MAPLSASSREASAPAPTTSVAGPAIYQQDTKQTASPSTIFSEFGGSISTRASPENCNNVLEQDEIDSNEEEERFESKNRKQIIMKSIGHEARISDYHTRPFTDLSKLGQISQQEASQLNENQHYMVSECVQGASSPTYSPYLEKLKTMGTSESRDYTEPPTADKGTRHQRHQNRTCTASEVSRSSNERVQTWNLGSNTTNCSSQNHQSLSNYSGSLSSDKTPSMNDSTARQQSIPLSSKSALSPSVSIPSTISSGYHGSSSTLYDRRQLNMQHKQCNVLGISNSQMNGRDDIVINGSTSKEPSAETILQLSDNHEEGSSGSQRDYRSEDRTPLQHINDITTSRTSSWDDSGGSIEVRSCEAGQADIRRLASSSYHIPQTSNPSSQISRSTVKSASPLRIVTTTPLPPPHLPSLIPPQVSSQTTKQQPESASSKQEEYKDMKIIDILTPNASPYSSLFTGRSSSIASSIPTTAASISYPTSATCQALNTEGIDDNALQLSQHRIDHWCSGKHDTSITEHEPATVSGRINIGSNKSSRRKSRYADFATPNIGEGRRADLGFSSHYGNRGWFHESCPHSRPPLLRSVSEDTPISHTLSKDPSPSTSPFGQVRYALPKGLENTSPHYEANLGYESLLMSSRALSTPSFISTNSSSALQASSSLYRNHNANAPHPPSETSSRNASNSISSSYSSTSTSITAASSKGSNWCSPETFSEKLPPRTSLTCLSDSSMTIKPANIHQSEINQKDCTSMNTPSKPRHSTSQSLGGSAAIPLFRTSQTPNQQSIKETKSRTSASPTSSTGGTSVKSTVDDQEVDINTDTLLASFDPDVAEAIRRAAAAVRNQSGNRTGPDVVRRDQVGGGGPVGHAQSGHGPSASSMSAMQNALMGACGNGYFGNAIRAKAIEILEELLPATVSTVQNEDVVGIAEYGCLNSLSSSIVPTIISQFSQSSKSKSQNENPPSFSVTYSDLPGSDFRTLMKQVDSTSAQHDYPFHYLNPPIYSSFTTRPFPAQTVPSRSLSVGISLMDLHCRRTPTSNGLSAAAAAHSELHAFLNTRAMEIKQGGLLLLAFIQRQEDENIAVVTAGRSKRAGDQDSPDEPNFTSPISSHISLEKRVFNQDKNLGSMTPVPFPSTSQSGQLTSSMHALSTSADSAMSTTSFLSASSASSNMSRRRSESSPCRPCFKTEAAVKRSDIWSTIPALLAPCIQRLVSTGLIKSDTASHLLTLPLHPRTPSQTRAVLRSVQHQWRTEWSCGLTEPSLESSCAASPSTPTPTSSFPRMQNDLPASLPERLDIANADRKSSSSFRGPTREDALTLSHPAYTAVQSTTLSRVQFAEHAIQFIRVLYETHFRNVLKDHAKLSRSRLEEVLDALNDVLREKLEEPSRALLSLELEVCMIALRRV